MSGLLELPHELAHGLLGHEELADSSVIVVPDGGTLLSRRTCEFRRPGCSTARTCRTSSSKRPVRGSHVGFGALGQRREGGEVDVDHKVTLPFERGVVSPSRRSS